MNFRLFPIFANSFKKRVTFDLAFITTDESDRLLHSSPDLSADGKQVAYVAEKERESMVIVDGKPGLEIERSVCGPVFRNNESPGIPGINSWNQ